MPSRGFVLFALLALAPAHVMMRAEAAAYLWDSKDTHVSLGNMRQLILRMQKSMPALSSILDVDDKTVRLVSPAQVDVCCLLNPDFLPKLNGLARLLDLYRGDLLQGLDVPSADEAIAVARTYLRERYFGLSYNALQEATRYGRAELSLVQLWERQALAVDPTREDTYRALIAAYGAIGHSDEARRVFAMLGDVLRREGVQGPQTDTHTAFARATSRSVGSNSTIIAQAAVQRSERPRIALLAPRWLAGAGEENYQRAFVEDVANELARYRSLITLAPHSSFLVAHDGGSLDDNSSLRADYTVSTFLRSGTSYRELVIRLVSCDTNAIVWADEFPFTESQVVHSNRGLVARIVSALADAVERHSLASLERTKEASAYFSYLRGQQASRACDLRSVRRGRKFYTQAIREDLGFSDAYSGVSSSLYMEWLLLGGNEPGLLSEARHMAELAIENDRLNSAGYWRKAMTALYQHDFDTSEECFERAQELRPNSADIILDRSDALGFIGDAGLAWSLFEQALDLNPTPPDHYWWAGASIAFSQAEYAKAIDLCGRLNSDESVLRLLAASHGQLGNKSEAREYGRRLSENYPGETAESMTRLQPHRSKADMQPFIDGLKMAGLK